MRRSAIHVPHVCAALAVLASLVTAAGAFAQPPRQGPPRGPASGSPAAASTAAFTMQLESAGRIALDVPAAAQAALDGDRAYVPLKDGRLAAVNLERGQLAWTIDLATAMPPAAGDSLVFVAGDELLTAVQPDGRIRWSVPIGGGFSAPPLWDSGWLVAATPDGGVICLRAVDGHVLWTARVASPVRQRPAIGGDHLYLSLEDGTVAALNLQTGAPVWTHRLGATPGPILPLDDRLFVGSRDKFFYCLDTKKGKEKWRWRTGGTITTPPVVDTERVYFTSLDNVLRALDRGNGSQKWDVGLPLRPTTGPLLVGDVVYVAGVAAELRGYRADEHGAPAGSFEAPFDLAAPPQLVPAPIPEMTGILLLTRSGDVLLLRVRLEPAVVPLPYPVGVEVPLTPPPVPVDSAPPPPETP